MITNLEQLSKLSNQLSTHSSSPADGPLFNSLKEYMSYLEACLWSEGKYVESKEIDAKAAEYNRRMEKFRAMTKGKNLTTKEKNKTLYGGK